MKQTKKSPTPEAERPKVDWSKYQNNTGFENVNREDLGIPFLMIIQKGSPEFDKSNPNYKAKKIDGVQVGDIINTLSREILYSFEGDPLIYVPCVYDKQFVEWKSRESGGGFIRSHKDPAILEEVMERNEKGQDVLRNGHVLVTTAYFFGYVVKPDMDPLLTVIGMTSTQLKKSRFWLNLMSGLRIGPQRMTPPMFSHSYKMTTIPENNEKGSWMAWNIEMNKMVVDQELIDECAQIASKNASRSLLGAGRPAVKDEEEPAM